MLQNRIIVDFNDNSLLKTAQKAENGVIAGIRGRTKNLQSKTPVNTRTSGDLRKNKIFGDVVTPHFYWL